MDGESVMKTQDSCYGGASLAGAVIGTFLTTILLLVVAALVYRQWRRHKGKHLVLVTNPEIVEDAYAFDNPCFKDATPAVNRNHDSSGPLSTASLVVETTPTTGKDSARWSSPWSSLVFTGTSVNKNDRRRTLDDSCLGTKATRISVVSLRSRDFTGLGFNVCGNMREGIFVKDLLHRGPASESGRINPGDRIASVKISFRSMVYEDALTILSYASPYDVELEVESGGGSGSSRPTTLLKKSVGPSTSRICHPLYRSQSIPELSQAHKTSSSKRLFIADTNNESIGSNYSTMNSTMKSSKSTPGNNQSLERRHEDAKAQNNHLHHHHHKFGIKVLPALDGTVHRIENQNEHNTNLERRNSRRLDIEAVEDPEVKKINATRKILDDDDDETRHTEIEHYQKRDSTIPSKPTENLIRHDRDTIAVAHFRSSSKSIVNGHDVTDLSSTPGTIEVGYSTDMIVIPSEVPAEVHNAAMAARRNRKNSTELLNAARSTIVESPEVSNDLKSPQKNKRKAPPPPINLTNEQSEIGKLVADPYHESERQSPSPRRNNKDRDSSHDGIESITDYVESLNDYVGKIREEATVDRQNEPIVGHISPDEKASLKRRNKSEDDSDNDSEIHDSFTTIELKPADITIHHTPTNQSKNRSRSNGHRNLNDSKCDDADEGSDDIYRKAASLGDLSKYENKSLATLERAQSLDMADAGSKKRNKHAVLAGNDDVNESSEDLTRIEETDTFDRRKLKKSNEWGTLEDAIWKKAEPGNTDVTETTLIKTRGRLNDTEERSRSAIETRNDENPEETSRNENDKADEETSLELYNLPLSIGLTREFVRTERMFDPDGDNSLARIVNNGRIIKSPTPSEIESDFRRATPDLPDVQEFETRKSEQSYDVSASPNDDEFGMAIRYFDRETSRSSINDDISANPFDIELSSTRIETRQSNKNHPDTEDSQNSLYAGKPEVHEEPMRRVTVSKGCPGCERKYARHNHECLSEPRARTNQESSDNRDPVDWKPQEISKTIPDSPTDRHDTNQLSAFKIGLTRFERSFGSSDPRHERKLLTKRDLSADLLDNNDSVEAEDPEVDEDDEESYDFGSPITVNSKTVTSPGLDRHNVSNVSVSSGENSEDSGLVRESGDYSRQDSSENRPPLPDTPAPISIKDSSPQKLTYITEINLSTSSNNEDSQGLRDTERRDNATKPSRNEVTLTSNGKTTGSKKPPVPPRRNDASKLLQSRDNETSNDKRVVYVSEYRTSSGGGGNKDRNESLEKTIRPAEINNEAEKPHRDKNKFENWIYLGDSERNPWGNGGSNSQQQPVTNIVVSGTGDDNNKNARQ